MARRAQRRGGPNDPPLTCCSWSTQGVRRPQCGACTRGTRLLSSMIWAPNQTIRGGRCEPLLTLAALTARHRTASSPTGPATPAEPARSPRRAAARVGAAIWTEQRSRRVMPSEQGGAWSGWTDWDTRVLDDPVVLDLVGAENLIRPGQRAAGGDRVDACPQRSGPRTPDVQARPRAGARRRLARISPAGVRRRQKRAATLPLPARGRAARRADSWTALFLVSPWILRLRATGSAPERP
jgi:hypothetical protein